MTSDPDPPAVPTCDRGMPNSPGRVFGDAVITKGILLGGDKFPRVHGLGMPKTGDVKFPMTPVQDGTGIEICNANCICANRW